MSLSCLTSDRMKAFLGGGLPPDEEADVARHLECCDRCEHLAAELSDDAVARQLAAMRQKCSAATRASREIGDVWRRLHALGVFEMATQGDAGARHRARNSSRRRLDGQERAALASHGKRRSRP